MELEQHLADRELAIAKAKADRQSVLDANRPNWSNSLADLLEWQKATGATAEEMTDKENRTVAIAAQLQEAGGEKWLNSNAYDFTPGTMMYIFVGSCWANIHFDGTMQITLISTGTSCDTGISKEALKAFFSNE